MDAIDLMFGPSVISSAGTLASEVKTEKSALSADETGDGTTLQNHLIMVGLERQNDVFDAAVSMLDGPWVPPTVPSSTATSLRRSPSITSAKPNTREASGSFSFIESFLPSRPATPVIPADSSVYLASSPEASVHVGSSMEEKTSYRGIMPSSPAIKALRDGEYESAPGHRRSLSIMSGVSNDTLSSVDTDLTAKAIPIGRRPAERKLPYIAFLESMKNAECVTLVKEIKEFIKSFVHSIPPPSSPEREFHLHSKKLPQFLSQLLPKFAAVSIWAKADRSEIDDVKECLEKFIMRKVHSHVFLCQPADDKAIWHKIRALRSFLLMRHLDIAPMNDAYDISWSRAIAELRNMNEYEAPRDKMVCILNACKVVTDVLTAVAAEKGDKLPGADEFLPALIWTVIQANPPHLLSNLEYIARYRAQEKLMSENGYFFMSINGAVSFVQNINSESLTITAEEFNTGMAVAGRDVEGAEGYPTFTGKKESRAAGKSRESTAPPITINANAALPELMEFLSDHQIPPTTPALKSASAIELASWKMQRFRFVKVDYTQLQMEDVGNLVREYQYLAKTCEDLLKERETLTSILQSISALQSKLPSQVASPKKTNTGDGALFDLLF